MRQLFTYFFCLFFSIAAWGQSEKLLITESFDNESLLTVFSELKQKYRLTIAYDYETVKDIPVNLDIKNADLATTFEALFAQTDLVFKITSDNRILVREEAPSVLLSTIPIKEFTFRGRIFDAQNGTPLSFATIFCPLTKEGCSANEDGNFKLAVHSKKSAGTLVIQYLGYVPKVIPWTQATDFSNLRIDLQAKALAFEEVTILEKLPTFSTNQLDGAITVYPKQMTGLGNLGFGNDIFRSLQLLPGISATDDFSSTLQIRGGNGDESGIILDGITLYKIDHYFGIFGTVNADMIDQVKVFKNAFPAEYGGRTAGIVDLTSFDVNPNRLEGGVGLNLLTAKAYLRLPITPKMGLTVGGRWTHQDVGNTQFFDLLRQNAENVSTILLNDSDDENIGTLLSENPSFRFYDVNAKWHWQLNNRTNLSASFFRGYDAFRYEYQRSFETENSRRDGRRDEVVNIETFSETSNWENQGSSLRLTHQWKPTFNSEVNLSRSTYSDSQEITTALVRQITRRPRPQQPDTRPTRIDTTFTRTNTTTNKVEGTELNIKNNWRMDDRQQLTFGYHSVRNQVAFNIDMERSPSFNEQVLGTQHALYAQYDFQKKQKFHLGLGLRNTFYDVTQKNYLSPRVNLSLFANEQLFFKAAASKYYQFLRQNYREDRFGRTYEFWVLSDEETGTFPIASAEQLMFGFNFRTDDFELDVEAYQKNRDGVVELAPLRSGFQNDEVTVSENSSLQFFEGTGRSIGVDLLLRKTSGRYTGWLAYTWSKTTHSFPQIDRGNTFPAQNDRRHQLKFVHQYRYKKWDFSATYVYSSGRAYTDLLKIFSEEDRRNLTAEDRISRLKDYHRIDVSANYQFAIKQSTASIGLSIFNLLDRQNVKYRQYIHSVPNERNRDRPINEVTGADVLMLGFTPNLNFSLDF
ncbi:MAG: TonB-dependent receptor [Bacteroidota bacterium]